MKHLARTVRCLEEAGVQHALIGASALAAQGHARSTRDIDLLVLDPRALEEDTWTSLRNEGWVVEVHRGDAFDPLAGVVRVEPDGENPVDVVVGHSFRWQRPLLRRAQARKIHVLGVELPLAEAADLVLLKLYAGGPRDRSDIEALLGLPDGAHTARLVDDRVADLPGRCRTLWAQLRPPAPGPS